jgi:hypothetical protein
MVSHFKVTHKVIDYDRQLLFYPYTHLLTITIFVGGEFSPHKISSYINQIDPDFESKSAVVLDTYKQFELLTCVIG